MNANKDDLAQRSGRDMTKFDAHVIQPEEYEELPELTDEMFARARMRIGDRELTDDEFAEVKKRMGRPPMESPKVALTMRVDADVMAALKAGGAGWQTRLNQLLRQTVLGESSPIRY